MSKGNSKKSFFEKDFSKLFFELIVVFLGVTAGFLLNNWKEKSSNKEIEKKYLENFADDIESNNTQLLKEIRKDSLWIKDVTPILKRIKNGNITLNLANGLLDKMTTVSMVTFKTGTYENIINSGNLNIISNYDVREQIVDYQLLLSDAKFLDDYYFQYFNEFVLPLLMTNYNFINKKITYKKVIYSTKFQNIASGYYSLKKQQKDSYKALLKSGKKLLKLLNKGKPLGPMTNAMILVVKKPVITRTKTARLLADNTFKKVFSEKRYVIFLNKSALKFI